MRIIIRIAGRRSLHDGHGRPQPANDGDAFPPAGFDAARGTSQVPDHLPLHVGEKKRERDKQ